MFRKVELAVHPDVQDGPCIHMRDNRVIQSEQFPRMQNHTTERLQRNIILYSVVGIFLVGAVIAGVGLWFYAGSLKQRQQNQLARELHFGQLAVQQSLKRIRAIAGQISSRTRVREILQAYNWGSISHDKMLATMAPKMKDAMNSAGDVRGVVRLDPELVPVLSIGLGIPDGPWFQAPAQPDKVSVYGPLLIDGKNYLVVTSAILDRSAQQVGSDVVLFSTRNLRTLMADPASRQTTISLDLGWFRGDSLGRISAAGTNALAQDPTHYQGDENVFKRAVSGLSGVMAISGDRARIIAFEPIEEMPWGLAASMPQSELYAPVWRQSAILAMLLLALTALGSVSVIFVLRPFTRRVISQASKLDQEIADRRRTEKELADKSLLLETTLENMDQGISVADANLNIVSFNKRFLELLDFPPDRFHPGMPFEAYIRYNAERGEYGPGDPEQQIRERVSLAREFKPHHFERTMANGTVLEIVGNIMPGGGFVTTYTDITAHKCAEQALRGSEQRFRALYDDNPSMFFTLNAAGHILSVNRFGAKQLGYPVDQLVGMSVLDLCPRDTLEQLKLQLEDCLKTPDVVKHWETVKLRKDGSSMWVREVVRVVIDEDNRIRIMTVCEDITEARELSEQLSYQANHDALTGLVNRRAFEDRVQKLLDQRTVRTRAHAICYLDLDQFKIINDTCGHVAGDELLRQLGGLLPKHVRRNDTLARLGGDEFGVLLENCTLQQAYRVTDELRKTIEEYRFAWEDKTFSVGASIGLVPLNGTGQTLGTVLAAADAACYTAKDGGRNRIHVFHEADADLAARQGEMQWLTRTQQALSEDRFRLYYQSITPAAGNSQGCHYEVLLRMLDEQGEEVLPGAFLPAAERYDLVTRLDRWVVRKTLSCLGAHPGHLAGLHECAINLSGQSLADEGFAEFVMEALRSNAVPAGKICFEITETAAISNLTSARQFFKKLKALGCRFALDDFGSGLSSFAYLKTLPVDYLKIDGVFIKDVVDDPIDLAMVQSINEIGHVMGKKTIAEFVESQEIHDRLVTLGVDFLQGYHIARPRPIEHLFACAPGLPASAAGIKLVVSN